MTLDYLSRAIVLGFGSFFTIHAVLGVAAVAMARALNFERMSPSAAVRLLLSLRLTPPLAAAAVTCLAVVPAYFLWERQPGLEQVAVPGVILALAGLAVCILGLLRSALALFRSQRVQARVVESADLFLAVAGIRKPRIVVSRGFLDAVPAAHREIAMRHELAHFAAADNLKRFLILLAPPLAPFCHNAGFRELEQAWALFAERVADDRAVGGDPERAAMLAEVLVMVARSECALAQLLASSLVGSAGEVHRRVERLLEDPAKPSECAAGRRHGVLLSVMSLLLLALIATQGQSQELFRFIERILLHH
jgi:hypothetical protein